MAGDETLFRKAALDRLASPDRLDERLGVPAYPRVLIVATGILLAFCAAFAAWLLLGRG
jgi:hypothetical protein